MKTTIGKTFEETAWLVERGDSSTGAPLYLAGRDDWTDDNLAAVRFARKEDAQRFAGVGDRVAEHAWTDRANVDTQRG